MGAVQILSKKQRESLAEQDNKSPDYARGYAAGIDLRRQGQPLQGYAMVGRDEWAQGCRAGYFGRRIPDSAQVPIAGTPEIAQKVRRAS